VALSVNEFMNGPTLESNARWRMSNALTAISITTVE